MRLRWSSAAIADCDAIRDYIQVDSPRAAINMDKRLWEAASSLKRLSGRGRSGRVKGTLELVVSGTPYVIAYRIEPGAIRIMRIVHAARRWPRRMSPL